MAETMNATSLQKAVDALVASYEPEDILEAMADSYRHNSEAAENSFESDAGYDRMWLGWSNYLKSMSDKLPCPYWLSRESRKLG